MDAVQPVRSHSAIDRLQAAFQRIQPRLELHARIKSRHVKCPHKRQDFIAEVVGLCWKWFKRLAEMGKDATRFPSVLASYAAKAVRSGRRVCGQLKAKDVLSERAQQKHGFCVGKLPDFSTLNDNPLQEALIDNTRSPVPDQVHFRLDFPAWRRTRSRRDRRIIDSMAMSERTLDLAEQFKISPARVSQLRREFHADWQHFTDADRLPTATS